MKRRTNRTIQPLIAAAALLALGVFTQPARARDHREPSGYQVLAEESLAPGKTTDLFLRKDEKGHVYLYVASEDSVLSVFDVTNPKELRPMQVLNLSGARSTFQVRPVSNRMAVATTAPDTGNSVAILDFSNLPSPKVAAELKQVDAYAIDGSTNTLYAAQRGKLVVMRFEHPMTREAEIWEESYNAR
jgi:hypothetical protein